MLEHQSTHSRLSSSAARVAGAVIYGRTWAMHQLQACQHCISLSAPCGSNTALSGRDSLYQQGCFARIGNHLSGRQEPESFGLFSLPQAEQADAAMGWRRKASPLQQMAPTQLCSDQDTPTSPPTMTWRGSLPNPHFWGSMEMSQFIPFIEHEQIPSTF